MIRTVRHVITLAAVAVLCWTGVHAQGTTAAQKPPDVAAKPDQQAPTKDASAKPLETPPAPELTADQKAFNAIAEEKDAQKRLPLYEKFIADYPKSSMLVSLARSEVQRGTLAALKTSATRYQDYVKAEIETAKKTPNVMTLPSTYQRLASELLGAGVMLAEAEEYSRQAVSLLDERKYIENAKQLAQRQIDVFNKQAANPTPLQAAAGGGVSIRSVNGAPTVVPTPPRPQPATTTPPRPPTAPTIPSDDSLNRSFNSQRASYLATLGQLLIKREKTAEGETVLKQAYDLKPPSYTVGTIAKLLNESARKAGDAKAQLEYLTVLALTGNITAAEQKELEGLYRSAHSGSLDGLDESLDARYVRENPKFEVKPADRKPSHGQRVVLAEDFTGAG
jgi:hypothetical protein